MMAPTDVSILSLSLAPKTPSHQRSIKHITPSDLKRHSQVNNFYSLNHIASQGGFSMYGYRSFSENRFSTAAALRWRK